jgi:iron complex outermembrane receptor protein
MSYSNTRAAVAAILGVAGVLAPVAGVWAQGAAAPDADVLQEVIITAERRATDVQTTPLAITAVSGDQLASQQISQISSLTIASPSFSVNDSGGLFNSINIRGVGNSAITPSIATGIAVFRDGLYLAETIGQDVPFYDIADTEILRGPQGTFVGASSTGGAVMINSQSPKLGGEARGYIEGTLGSYSDVKVQGAVNLPVSDTFAARIAFNSEQRGSFFRDNATVNSGYPSHPAIDPGNVDQRDVRVGLLWKPTEKLEVLGKLEYDRSKTDGTPGQPNPGTYTPLINTASCQTRTFGGTGTTATGSPLTELYCAPYSGAAQHSPFFAYYSGSPYVLNGDRTDRMYNQLQTRYALDTHYTMNNGDVFRSISGFQHFDIFQIPDNDDSSLQRGMTFHTIGPNNNYYSQEFTLTSPAEQRVSWIVGAYGFYRDTPVRTYNYTYNFDPASGAALGFDGARVTPGAAIAGNTNGVVIPGQMVVNGQQVQTLALGSGGSVQRMAAVFGQLTWKLSSTLDLQVGLRENWDNLFNYVNNTQAGTYRFNYVRNVTTGKLDQVFASYTPNPTAGGALNNTHASAGNKDSVPTAKVGLNWQPIDGQFFYAFYARGYKSVGVANQQLPLKFRTFDNEHINDFELGWKGKLLDGHLQTQIGAYYMAYQNMQYPIFDPSTTGTVVANMGNSKIAGLEASIQARFGGLGIDLGMAYNDTKLGDISLVPGYLLGTLNTGGIAVGANTYSGSKNQCVQGMTLNAGAACFDYTAYTKNLSGTQNPFSPKITANLQVSYSIPVGDHTLRPRVLYSHTDKQYASIFQGDNTFLLGSRDIWNANLDYEAGDWSISGYGTNLTGRTYLTSANSATEVFYGAPRQVGIRFNRKF